MPAPAPTPATGDPSAVAEDPSSGTSRGSAPTIATAAAATVILAAIIVALTGGSPGRFLAVLLAQGWAPAIWLVAAAGWGGLLAPSVPDRERAGPATRLALGVALMLVLDSAVLRLVATPAAAWAILLPGLVGAAFQAWRSGRADTGRATRAPAAARSSWLLMVPAAVLLAAAAAEPGWLWASEFGGYDALSYHLQLPAEWAEAGRATPLPHNVYAFLPNAVEHAFLHVGLLTGDPRTAGPAAHFLHAAMAVGAATATGGLAQVLRDRLGMHEGRRWPAWSGGVAGLLLLATPWVIVTGSLAYTEMAVLWMMAASLRLAADARSTWRPGLVEGAVHGLLSGAAVAAKLTAGPIAVLPAIAWWLIVRRRDRTTAGMLAMVALGGILAGGLSLAPWLIAGAVHAGNPLFPFATDLLGAGHWTAEQVAAWRAGHGGGGGPADVAREWLVHGIAGDEPAQWGVLPLAGLLACGVLAARGPAAPRRIAAGLAAMLGIAVLGWTLLTHAESRFLLPTSVPLAVAVALLPAGAGNRERGGRAPDAAAWLVASVQILWLLIVAAGERGGRAGLGVGAGPILRGEAHQAAIVAARAQQDRATLTELRTLAPPTWWTRYGIKPEARVLMIGETAVFHHPPDGIAYRTVWDRDQLSRWLDEADVSPGGPDWIDRARAAGFTHVYVDRVMLENWAERGWNDPRMQWETLVERAGGEAGAAAGRLELLASFDGGGRLLLRLGDA